MHAVNMIYTVDLTFRETSRDVAERTHFSHLCIRCSRSYIPTVLN